MRRIFRTRTKRFMADLSPTHMQARTVLRQLQKHLGPLSPPLPDANQISPVLAAVTHFPSPRESACRSLEISPEMRENQPPGSR
jgi:cleavage stimulation factor subunit 3